MAQAGKVYLVGAGPGDPGLITAKGLKCLAEADVVLYDGLVNPLLLLNTSATATRTCRTCTAQGRVLNQEEINQRLIEAALARPDCGAAQGRGSFHLRQGQRRSDGTQGSKYRL